MRKRKLFFLITIIIVGAAILTMFFCRRNKYKDLCKYTEKLLEIEWNNCIEVATGNVETEIWEEDFAYIKLKVKKGYEEVALSILQDGFGESLDISRTIMPGYQGHPFAIEIKEGNLQYIFASAMEGKRAKTRDIWIYVVYDEKGQMYIYNGIKKRCYIRINPKGACCICIDLENMHVTGTGRKH